MTREQHLFKVGLKKLDRFDKIQKTRELTWQEEQEISKIKEVLFASVRNYGISLVRQMTQKYKLPNDSYSDLCQDLAVIFYDKFRAYNPDLTTPTTYFVRYFKQVISNYLIKNIHKLSQYDAGNVLKVRRAINYYESKGIDWTEEMLSTRTELSLKVVHATLLYSSASNYVQIDDAFDLASHIKTPEEAYTDKETTDTLLHVLKNSLDENELELLLMRVNLDDNKELPYEKIANIKKMSVRDVKRTINGCICKVNQDKGIVERFAKPTMKKYKSNLIIQKPTNDLMESQLEDFLSHME